jgi:DNA polymerase-3 subunit gamma/tau
MGHRALTLKYRPQVFADMIGQDHVSAVLTRAIAGGRVAQAYLFTGARGVGKTTCARILAKALNCERRAADPKASVDPCNQCSSCNEITTGVSLDVIEIDGASNRGIADVQALREKVRFAPTGGRHRVVIIDEVHQLSNDAFAALLKTLEEPPPHLVFIFATTDPQKLPDTIRSRCQRFDFARVPLRKVADRLLEIQKREAADPEGVRFTIDEGAALLIAHKSEGSMRDAVSALDQVVSAGEPALTDEVVRRVLGIADREVFFGLGDAIFARDPKAALAALHEGFDKGLDARDLAEGLSEHVRHVLILKVDPEAADLVALSAEDIARLKTQGAAWSQDDLLRLLKLASDALFPMRDSPQPLIHLEAAVVQMATLEPGDTLAELLQRLESLERRLAGVSPAAPATPPARPGAPVAGGAPPRIATPAPAAAAAAPRVEPAPEAPPRSAATATLERDEQVESCWREAIAATNLKKRMLGAFLEESRLVGLADDELVVAMDDLHRTVVEEKENRALVVEAIARAFNRPLALRVAPLAAAGLAPPAPVDYRPLVDQAIAWFQGDPIERPGPPTSTDPRRERNAR